MNKYYNEKGEIGLIVSPGFGAGWASWSHEKEFCLMDKTLVEMCLRKAERKEVEDYLLRLDIYMYTGGWNDTCVTFLPPNTPFYLAESGGSEHIVTEFNNTGK